MSEFFLGLLCSNCYEIRQPSSRKVEKSYTSQSPCKEASFFKWLWILYSSTMLLRSKIKKVWTNYVVRIYYSLITYQHCKLTRSIKFPTIINRVFGLLYVPNSFVGWIYEETYLQVRVDPPQEMTSLSCSGRGHCLLSSLSQFACVVLLFSFLC